MCWFPGFTLRTSDKLSKRAHMLADEKDEDEKDWERVLDGLFSYYITHIHTHNTTSNITMDCRK